MKSRRKRPDQASRRRGQSPRQAHSRQQRSLFQIDVQRIAAGPCGHAAHATGNGPLLLGRYGQNGPPIALGRRNSLFAGNDGGAHTWAILASLLTTAKLNGLDPYTWLNDVLERIVTGQTRSHELDQLLAWNWKAANQQAAEALAA
jgi:hypothetical protein